MKPARPSITVCMLCDEPVAHEHWVSIVAVGIDPPVRCCPECYAMFSDFHTALRLMPPGADETFGVSAASRHPRKPTR